MIDFKTASLLKENGFPQPIKQFGQTWYCRDGLAWVIGRRSPDGEIKAVCIVVIGAWEHLYDTNGFVYAPTPTDIMEYLQIEVGKGRWWVLTPPLGDGLWHLSLFFAPEDVRLRFEGESAEDVCLKALFQKWA